MKKIIYFIFINILNTNIALATQISNTEALENINISLERIENAITTLTSQNEENNHNQKQIKSETIILFKDMKLQITELKENQSKLSKELENQKQQIEELKKTVLKNSNYLQKQQDEKNKEIEEFNKIQEAKATKNPELLINNVNSNNKNKELEEDKIYLDKAIELYNNKDYINAITKFTSNLKNYPNSNYFYNNLLYLGLTMKELNNNNDACIAFSKIIDSKEEIELNLKNTAIKTFNDLNCNKDDK